MANGIITPVVVEDKKTITSSSGTIIVENCRRFGKIVVFNCYITLPVTPSNTVIIELPWKADGRYDFLTAISNGSKTYGLAIGTDTTSLISNNGNVNMDAGSYIISGTYVTNE